MTAKEAKNISIESKVILEKINEAAFKGLNQITIYNISSPMTEGLKKLGYDIKGWASGFNETSYIISW